MGRSLSTRSNEWIKRKLKDLRNNWGGKCQNMGHKIPIVENLEFAHKHNHKTDLSKKRGRGRKERYYDIMNNPESYILLCKTCHRIYDGGEDLKI